MALVLEVKRQQELMRSLRVFIDALRDVKSDKPSESIDDPIKAAILGLCGSEGGVSTPQYKEMVWKYGLVTKFQQLGVCMARIDQLESEVHANASGPKKSTRPTAPAGLLSLRDYSVLQAAMEILFCWGAFPCVESGILQPVEKRRPTRTLAISAAVLQWGSFEVGQRTDDARQDLLTITQAMLQVLFLPQFQPILLPKYVVDLLALLIYGESLPSATSADEALVMEFQRLRVMVLRALPVRLSMSSLRAVLGQCAGAAGSSPSETVLRFKQLCGQLLSQFLMTDGGVLATIEMLLGAVDEGNTQARMQVATLICQCPSEIDSAEYYQALCRQLADLFSAANRSNKLIYETAVLIADQLVTRHPDIFDVAFLSPVFRPLLLYEDTRYDTTLCATEGEVTECVAIAHLLLCGPPPSQKLLQALAPLIRPLLHLHGFAVMSKSFLRQSLEALLLAWIRLCTGSALLLHIAVLPITPPLCPTLLSCGYERNQDIPWRPIREFGAGESGGIVLKMADVVTKVEEEDDSMMSLKLLVLTLKDLLCSKELETSEVVGELFSSLLLTYMQVRKLNSVTASSVKDTTPVESAELNNHPFQLYNAFKFPQTQAGVEMILTLLLGIIETVGPSVLRSAATVLQCIGTVLETYNEPITKLVDSTDDTLVSARIVEEMGDDEQDGDEMLTICLGVVMTILEAGSTKRSAEEENELRKMLPVLEVLSQHSRLEIAQLASEARVKILSRGAVTKNDDRSAREDNEKLFDVVLQEAEDDLRSALVPLRARGVVTLTKLIRKSQQHRHDSKWTPRIEQLLAIFLNHLEDSESYVYLAAVQGLSTLSDAHPDVAIPLLVRSLRDSKYSLEKRIKLSEALLFTAKRCGETLQKYAKVFVYAYLDCIRPPPAAVAHAQSSAKRFQLIQEIDSEKENASQNTAEITAPSSDPTAINSRLAEATLRASCLSNLAEVCAILQWGMQPFVVDVLTCVFGILQLELDIRGEQSVVAVRRGAVFVLKYIIQLMGWKLLEIVPDQLKPIYHTLKHVERTDRDQVVVFHARKALEALGDVMRAELFPRVDQQDQAFGISSLRIVK